MLLRSKPWRTEATEATVAGSTQPLPANAPTTPTPDAMLIGNVDESVAFVCLGRPVLLVLVALCCCYRHCTDACQVLY
jgi:hypothetical protein